MKTKKNTYKKSGTFLFLICFPVLCFSQQGFEILPSIFTSTLPEIQSLRAIEDNQEFVANATKNIAFKTAGVYLLKKAEYEEMSNIANRLENSPKVERVASMAAQVYSLYLETTELIENYPNVETISYEQVLVVSEIMLQILADLDLVLTGGGENLMDTVDRLELIDELEKDMSQLFQSIKLLKDLTLTSILTEYQILDIEKLNIEPITFEID